MRNAKGVSDTGKIRAQFNADEHAILFFTGMTHTELTDFKMDCGQRWISLYCMSHAGFTKEEAESMWMEAELLQWWNLEWRRMDHFVILPILHKIVEAEREAVYKAMHTDVFLEHHPNYKTLELALYHLRKAKVKT